VSILIAALLTPIQLPQPPVRRDEIVVVEAGDLVDVCREEATAHYVGKRKTVYQWAASHKSRGNGLFVDGRLRVEGEDVRVACMLPKGARLAYMTIDLEKP
jgi:prepilin-type processing-associated H-X9-DG protein